MINRNTLMCVYCPVKCWEDSDCSMASSCEMCIKTLEFAIERIEFLVIHVGGQHFVLQRTHTACSDPLRTCNLWPKKTKRKQFDNKCDIMLIPFT